MPKSVISYIWSADVIVDRGPIDAPLAFETNNSADVTFGEADLFNDMMMQDSARVWLAGKLGVDPAAVTFLNYSWLPLDAAPVDEASDAA